jgi:hypothetical protein
MPRGGVEHRLRVKRPGAIGQDKDEIFDLSWYSPAGRAQKAVIFR